MSDTTSAARDSAFLQAFLDSVIPPGEDGKLPGAGAIGLGEGMAERLEADAALGPLVLAGLAAVRDAALERDPGGLVALSPQARAEVIESQLAAHPMLMLGMGFHVYPAYYQHPRVLEGLGAPGRTPFPEGYDLEPTDPALLEKLLARRRA